MEIASRENPNVCKGCAQLLDDLSPLQAAADLSGNVRAKLDAKPDAELLPVDVDVIN